MSEARVALVLVSHSADAAHGVAEIARQMAPDVTLLPAGGIDGGIGTSLDAVLEAVASAHTDVAGRPGDPGVVVLTDLGSAVLTAQTALELLDEEVAAQVRVPDAPFLEAAVAAAVAAQQGEGLGGVESAAVQAGLAFAPAQPPEPTASPASAPQTDQLPAAVAAQERVVTRQAVLRNALGLHARPSAVLARAAADLGVPVRVGAANAASVLELMRLGARGGDALTVSAEGPRAGEAVDAIVELLESGFGED